MASFANQMARAALLAVLSLGSAVRADTLISKTSYSSWLPSWGNYTVPSGATYLVIKAWGAGGAGGFGSYGGGGGYIQASLNVQPGQKLQMSVGNGGYGGGDGNWQPSGNVNSSYGALNTITAWGWDPDGIGDTWDYVPWGGNGDGNGGGSWVTGSGGQGGGSTKIWAPDGSVLIAGGGGGGSDFNAQNWSGQQPNGGGGGNSNGGYGNSPGGYANAPGPAGTNATLGTGGGGGGGGTGGSGGGWYGGNSPYGGGGGGSCFSNGSFFNVTVRSGDAGVAGNSSDSDRTISGINVGDPGGSPGNNGGIVIYAYQGNPPVITSSTSQQNVLLGQSVSYTITATNSPTSFGSSGLPPGLSVNTSSGLISGTPSTAGLYNSTITAQGSTGYGSANLTWAIASISPNGSVTPAAIYLNQSVQLYRNGTANFGVAFTDNTIWKPDGTYDYLGMMGLGGPTTYTATMTGTYYWQYRVVDIYDNYEDEWLSFSVTLPTVEPPTSVTSATTGSTFITVTWSGASAQVGIDHYNVYRNGVLIAMLTSTSYSDNTVTPGASYTYQIATVDSQGNLSALTSGLTITAAADFEAYTPLP